MGELRKRTNKRTNERTNEQAAERASDTGESQARLVEAALRWNDPRVHVVVHRGPRRKRERERERNGVKRGGGVPRG